MNLVIDIGNTQTKMARFDKGKIADSIRILNSDQVTVVEWIQKQIYEKAIYCAVGRLNDKVFDVLKKYCRNVVALDQNTLLPFKMEYRTPDTLGYDRIAAVCGALKAFPGENVLIFDFGTAITIDFLTSTGEYRGGNISPGLDMRFKSLHNHTANLPLVVRDLKHHFFGDDTQSAITAGVQMGILFEISGYIHQFMQQYGDCRLLATGGDADFIIQGLKEPVILYPDLIMEGMHDILEYNTTPGS